MIIPRNDTEEFEFYSKFFRNFHLNLSDERDKRNVILWFKKLRNDDESLIKIKKEYLKLLLFLLQRQKIISPFSKPPKSGPLPENLDQLNLTIIAKKLCEPKSSSRDLKKKLIRTADISGDSFAVFQKVPKWGVHGFVSYNKRKSQPKPNSNTNTPNPFHLLFVHNSTQVQKNPKSKNGKYVTFADAKGLDGPYAPKSRHGQGIISSTTFLNQHSSNITQLERELQSENLCPSNTNVSKLSKNFSSKNSGQISKKKSSTESQSLVEELYYSSQCDTMSQKSDSLIIEEITEEQDGTQSKKMSDTNSAKKSLQKQKSRNYYSLNDLQTLKSELTHLLKDPESKVSKKEIKVLNKKTFVIKSKGDDKSKKIDDNQYFDVVNFGKKKFSPVPTTWIRCKTNSERRSYVMRTYPTESTSSIIPKFLMSTSTLSFKTNNSEMEELLSILNSIKQDMESAEKINQKFVSNYHGG